MAGTAGRSSWIPIIIASLIFGIAVVIITKLNNMYQNKVLFDYSQEVVGKFFTYMIIIYFII
jgi:spore germination protein